MQAQQVQVAAAIQRERGHLFLPNDISQLRAGGVYLAGSASNLHRLGDCTDRQLEISPVLLINFELDHGLHRGPKSGHLGPDRVIFPDGESEKLVVACRVGLNPTLEPGIRVLKDHSGIGDGGAARVRNRS